MSKFKPEERGLAAATLSAKIVELLVAKNVITRDEGRATFDATLKQLDESGGTIAPGAASFLRYLLSDDEKAT